MSRLGKDLALLPRAPVSVVQVSHNLRTSGRSREALALGTHPRSQLLSQHSWPRIFFSGNLFSLDITCVCRLRLVLGSYTLGRGRLAGLFGCGFISMNLWRSTGICDPSRGAACRRERLGRTPDLLNRQLRCQGAEGDRIPAHVDHKDSLRQLVEADPTIHIIRGLPF